MKVMRKILLGLIIFITIIGLALFFLIKSFNLNDHLSFITEQASQLLGREVKIQQGDLQISIDKGLIIQIQNVKVAEAPVFGNQDFLALDRVSLGIDIKEFIFKREIVIKEVILNAPQIRIIRSNQEKLNVQSFAFMGNEKSEDVVTLKSPKDKSGTVSAENKNEFQPPQFRIASLKIIQGQIDYIDRTFKPALSIKTSQLDLSIVNFSLSAPFQFKLQAAVPGTKQNFNLNGTARINPKENQLRLDDTRVNFDLSAISKEEFLKAFPMLEPAGIKDHIEGNLRVLINPVVIGPTGILVLNGELNFQDGQIALIQLNSPLSQINLTADITESKIDVNKFSLKLADGNLEGKAQVTNFLAKPKTEFKFHIESMELRKLIDQSQLPMLINGKLIGDLEGELIGLNDQALNNLKAQGKIEVLEGVIEKANLLKLVLGKIPFLPAFADQLGQFLPEDLQSLVMQQNTPITKANFPITIDQGRIFLNQGLVEVEAMEIQTNGSIGFNQIVDLNFNFFLNPRVSESLVKRVAGFASLQDGKGRVVLPAKLSGKLPKDVHFEVTIKDFGQKMIMEQGKTEIKKVLDKNPEVKEILNSIFNGGDGERQTTDNQIESQQPEASDNPPVLDDIFNKIFK